MLRAQQPDLGISLVNKLSISSHLVIGFLAVGLFQGIIVSAFVPTLRLKIIVIALQIADDVATIASRGIRKSNGGNLNRSNIVGVDVAFQCFMSFLPVNRAIRFERRAQAFGDWRLNTMFRHGFGISSLQIGELIGGPVHAVLLGNALQAAEVRGNRR